MSVSDRRPAFSVVSIAAMLVAVFAGLPLAVWLDLRALSEEQLSGQAEALSDTIDDLRDFYAESVVARAVAHDGPVSASHRYLEEPGGIPIPATFSLELVSIFSSDGDEMTYRFVSDYPFANRPPVVLTPFERAALETLTADPSALPYRSTGSLLEREVSIASPVLMGQACVDCHNAHPESPRQNWQVGDVRAVQAITLRQSLGANVFAFRSLAAYFAMLAVIAAFVLIRLRAQSRSLQAANRDLAHANDFLASVSMKVGRYISPKVYRRIFAGDDDNDLSTNRRKLTIFFSDVQGFTEISERLQPEELTRLLNAYFTEMAEIAEAHGGTLDKFVGDAVLVFFGDPVSNGVREDARAAMRMALAMQTRIAELTARWRSEGITWPFAVRMGINTGYCNVGNFGSADRLSYTIIGAEVNLAARLQEHCGPGEIAISEETQIYVSDMAPTVAAGPITVKGIAQPVRYYIVPKPGETGAGPVAVDIDGLQLTLDPGRIGGADQHRARAALEEALRRLNPE
ncbi:adenylate/guanylate cyclase domain-containing protein [Cognatishimia sp. F0-27]|uniref:adenylate/guanylate cyclase domain-containing protein n=1 Tax=Cognatishimia sp. F0-27 TaxID=2816855 RepID=UPI001D0C08EB|nr:adenylate/guanylate cyclase domain-containing protein [Cognatishimia sp. F0-27]MCC1494602.1 adenylate/guanylate cyclase domain-containing protein [Cognatishimia sp. F0-27]